MRRLLVAIATCAATAKAAAAQIRPHVPSLGDTPLLVTPGSIDTTICFDFTRDGRTDVALTVASGGTAGDVGWLILRRTPSGWRLTTAHSGYKLGIFRVGRDLADTQPIYRKNDPNCCPSGGFAHEQWHWNGMRFVIVRAWMSKSFEH